MDHKEAAARIDENSLRSDGYTNRGPMRNLIEQALREVERSARASERQAALEEVDKTSIALRGCYALARRQRSCKVSDNEAWLHVIRLCEEAGLKPNILRTPQPESGSEEDSDGS